MILVYHISSDSAIKKVIFYAPYPMHVELNLTYGLYFFNSRGKLIQHYDEMHNEQPKATEILNDEMPDICATGEPGMKPEEIEEFKAKLRKEYERTLRYVV